jgi:hypothetical protein
MRCPRCDGSLITFSIDEGEDAAVVCESCGFAGVPASHHSDGGTPESWDAALDRLDGETLLERTKQVARSRGVSIPDRIEDEPTVLDGDRLDEVGVSVSASIDGESDRPDDETGTDSVTVDGGTDGEDTTAEDGDDAGSADETTGDDDDSEPQADETDMPDEDGDEATADGATEPSK